MAKEEASSLLSLHIEFAGGMELLFDSQHSHDITLPRSYDPKDLKLLPPLSSHAGDPTSTPPLSVTAENEKRPSDVRFLIWWLKHFKLTDKKRPDLFTQGETIRPGILILINATDWELEGELDYELQSGDEIIFISTLHGG